MQVLRAAACLITAVTLCAHVSAHDPDTHALMTKRAAFASNNLQSFLHRCTQLDHSGHPDTFPDDFPQASIDLFRQLHGLNYRPEEKDVYDCLMAGAVLEDAGVRSLNHFYDPTTLLGAHFDAEAATWATAFRYLFAIAGASEGLNAVNQILGQHTSALDWALANQASNEWGWNAALDYYYRAYTDPDPAVRRQNAAKMYRALGQCVHLLQDLTQPSHVRNDAHAGHDLLFAVTGVSKLEDWEKFHLSQNGRWNPTVGSYTGYWQPEHPTSGHVRDYYLQLATWTASNWFSDDTIFGARWNPTLTQYPTPAQVLPPPLTAPYYVHSSTSTLPSTESGEQGARLCVARPAAGPPIDGSNNWLASPDSYTLNDQTVLVNNAALLVNKGIAQSTALIDHFFRGKLLVECDPELGLAVDLRIWNISSEGNVGLDLGAGTWEVYYTSANEALRNITPYVNFPPSTGGVPNGAAIVTIPPSNNDLLNLCYRLGSLSRASLPDDVRVDSQSRLIVVFRGLIGGEDGIAIGETIPRRAYSVDWWGSDPVPDSYYLLGACASTCAYGPKCSAASYPVVESGSIHMTSPGVDDTISKAFVGWRASFDSRTWQASNSDPCGCNSLPCQLLTSLENVRGLGSVSIDGTAYQFASPYTDSGMVEISFPPNTTSIDAGVSVTVLLLGVTDDGPLPGMIACPGSCNLDCCCCSGLDAYCYPDRAYGSVVTDD